MGAAPSRFRSSTKPRARCSPWRFSPLPKATHVPETLVQQWLTDQLVAWGPPRRFRVDNGWPWGSSGDLPPVLSLWLMGWDCAMHWNRPAHPQENALVERFHGLQDSWGEPEACADWPAWTERMAWVVKMQREVYPAVDGQSRLAAHPELHQNPRRPPAGQPLRWELKRVQAYLARGRWVRQVNKKGQITLYHRPFSVGSRLAGQQVYVRFDAETNEWVVVDRQGNEVKRRAATELSAERIQALDISYVKPHQRRQRQERPIPTAHFVT
jgi:hypothetical protein